VSATRKTAFDRYLEGRMNDPEFAEDYRSARREIDAIDTVVRTLDAARIRIGLSKAALAREIGARPEFVRRLFTAEKRNPTLRSVVKMADALGLVVQLVPAAGKRRAKRVEAARTRRRS
jgi:DNA-binding phage protein